MEFVKVRHEDGREAEITGDEVKFYKSIGFKPVDGEAIDRADPPAVPDDATQPPTNGTDQRLDLVLEELRGLRADLAASKAPAEPAEPADGETVELREPERPNLDALTREQLNEYATELGIADAADTAVYAKKADLIDAIEGVQQPQE